MDQELKINDKKPLTAAFKLGNFTDFYPLVMATDKINLQEQQLIKSEIGNGFFPTEGTFALDPHPPGIFIPCGRVCACHQETTQWKFIRIGQNIQTEAEVLEERSVFDDVFYYLVTCSLN